MMAWIGWATFAYHLLDGTVQKWTSCSREQAMGERWVVPSSGDLVDPKLCRRIVVQHYDSGSGRDEPRLVETVYR
jgi:hypothetical protein